MPAGGPAAAARVTLVAALATPAGGRLRPPVRNPSPTTWCCRSSTRFEVLQRNAAGETRYRYYRPGSYEVVLQAFDGERYADVSNRVSITC